MFLYLAYQGVHEPRQSPEHYYDAYNESIADLTRRQFAGMLVALDEGITNVPPPPSPTLPSLSPLLVPFHVLLGRLL